MLIYLKIIFTERYAFSLFIDIDEEFKTQLRDLTPSVLSSDNLVVKSLNGGEVTCRGLLEYFKVTVTLYLQSGVRRLASVSSIFLTVIL